MKHSILFLLSGVCLFFACQAPKEQASVVLFENGTGNYNTKIGFSNSREWNGRKNSIELNLPPLGMTVLKYK